MKTVFDGIEALSQELVDVPYFRYFVYRCGVCLMFAPLSSYVALSIVFSISMLISGILEILFCNKQQACIQLGLVSCRRYHRPHHRHLPRGLPDGQHGNHSVPHCLLAYVPWFLCHRLFDGPQTVWHPRLGMVHGFRHSCHSLFAAHFVGNRQ